MTEQLLPGAEPWSLIAGKDRGALVIHGLTSNPASMRGIADAFAAAGYDVELPRLPGHGTTVDDLLTTDWADWSGEVETAYQRLATRCRTVVVVGLSLGGALTLWLGTEHPEIAGLVCINPVAQPQPFEIIDMIAGAVADGTELFPGVGGDIADPESSENAYDGTPVAGLLSLLNAVADFAQAYPTMRMPLMLMNSPQDHVVEPAQAEYLATHFGGPLERITLERSYHVATLDYDKDLICAESVAFAHRVTA